MFYVDFRHHALHGQSITGGRYYALEYGPCPKWGTLVSSLEDDGLIEKQSKYTHDLRLKTTLELSAMFSDEECRTIYEVIAIGKKHGKQFVFDQSHDEPAYLETEKNDDPISYEKFSKKLKLFKKRATTRRSGRS